MNKNEKSAEKIFQLLKENGAMTAKQLSEQLQMTTMGVRQHLQLLEDSAELDFFDQKALRGRPTRFWKLTEKANRHFDDRHEELTVQLLISVREVFGEQGLDKLIAQREKSTLSIYLQAMVGLTTVEQRLIKLVELRIAEGYMASYQEQAGDYLFFENHCPICAAATACIGFCRSELDIFQRLFLGLASITREEHIVQGARRCAYKINVDNI